jgi:serine/threonine protein kinase
MLAEDGKLSSIVICDFGVAAAVPKGANLSGLYGSPDYISPEMHKGMDYTYEPDMWSLGIISYIMYVDLVLMTQWAQT